MSAHLNLSQPAYGKLEKGETRMDFERLFKIAGALEVDPIELMQLEGQPVIQYNNRIAQNIKENYISPELNESYQQTIDILKAELEQCRKEKNELLQLIARLK